MKIKHEKGDKDAWICVCGNTPAGGGFYASTKEGVEVEPDGKWNGIYYVCFDCKAVINFNTRN